MYLLSFQASPEDKSRKRAQRPKMRVSFEPFGFIKVGSAGGDQSVRGELEPVPPPVFSPGQNRGMASRLPVRKFETS